MALRPDITLEISGVKETERALLNIGRAGLRISGKAMSRAMTPVKRETVARARAVESSSPWFTSGALSKSMAKKVKAYKKSSTVVGLVGPRKAFFIVSTRLFGYANVNVPANILHLITEGVKPHDIGTGKSTGPGKRGGPRVSRDTDKGPFMGRWLDPPDNTERSVWRHPGFAGNPIMAKALVATAGRARSEYRKGFVAGLEAEAAKQARAIGG